MKVEIGEISYRLTDVDGRMLYVPNNGGWTFNGDKDNPTFMPSIKTSVEHYTITNGKVQYLEGDPQKGQTNDIKDLTKAQVAWEEHKEELIKWKKENNK